VDKINLIYRVMGQPLLRIGHMTEY